MFWDNNETNNIVDKFLTWKWAIDTWYFIYYDKKEWIEKKYDLWEFILIRKSYNIKWFSKVLNKPIYSNKIDKFDEELIVKAWDNVIIKWLYKDIKWDLVWWILHLTLTVLHNWEVIDIPVKWLAFFELNEVIKDTNTNTNKIKFIEAKDWGSWAIKFRTPTFWTWWEITEEEKSLASEIVKTIKDNIKIKSEEVIPVKDLEFSDVDNIF